MKRNSRDTSNNNVKRDKLEDENDNDDIISVNQGFDPDSEPHEKISTMR